MVRKAVGIAVLIAACGGEHLSDAEIKELIAGSDDVESFAPSFVAATRTAIAEGPCTRDQLIENGNWTKSQAQRTEPIYFLNCGLRKVYTNVATGETEGSTIHRDTEAFVMCQDPVRRQLRSPATAKFPYISNRSVRVAHIGLGQYSVDGFVDAQNAFGATVRTTWNCRLQYTGTGWRLERVQLGT
jgi:hypothetical protein